MKQVLNAVVVGLGLVLGGQAALADKYPSKPVNMVIPYGPGGATDVSARNLAAPLGKQFNPPYGESCGCGWCSRRTLDCSG
jgi:tripartite-type tricarboxylate transporter receptor subunit TctC